MTLLLPPIGSRLWGVGLNTVLSALDARLAALETANLTTRVAGVEGIAGTANSQPLINVKVGYGAIGDGVTDDTAAIQAALDAAGSAPWFKRGAVVFLPPGTYRVTQLAIPACVRLQGAGWHGFSTNATILKHTTAQTVDMIRFVGNSAGFAGPCGISDLQLIGHPSSTAGCGINTAPGAGSANAYAKLQDSSTFERLYIRGFAEDGFRISGGSPARVANVGTLWNGGYGIKVVDDGSQGEIGQVHAVVLENVSGDGNSGGAAVRLDGLLSMASVTIIGLKSERRNNDDRGGSLAQPNALQVNNCLGSVTVAGLGHICSGAYTTRPGDAIVVSGTNRPTITWSGLSIRQLSTQTVGAVPNALADGSLSVPASVASGDYGTWRAVGGAGAVKPAAASNLLSVAGTVPGLSLSETDQGTDGKHWAMLSSVGVWSLRCIADDGSTGSTPIQVTRTGSAAGNVLFGVPVVPDTDNTRDIGNPSGFAWRNAYLGTGLRIKEGTNKRLGVATLVGGTVTVANTSVTASTRIFLTTNTPGGTVGAPYVSARVAGTSFTITSTSASDTSVVAWSLVEPF